jgi:hypothetical protein
MGFDPGSEIRDPVKTYSGSRIQGSKRHRIPDPGIKKAPDPGSRILIRNTETKAIKALELCRPYLQ